MTIFAITCIFHANVSKFMYNFAFNNLKVVSTQNCLLVHFINVGQGDAIAINFPTGKTMLIDTGTEEKSVTYTNYIKDNVISNSQTKKLDYLVLTHADNDHIGGALRLLNEFEIGTVYLPYLSDDTETYIQLKNYITENCNFKYITNNLDIKDTGCKLSTFGPLDMEEENDTCPVIKLEYKNKSLLFTGDVSTKAESILINEYGEALDCDILKVAHHGSNESTSQEFLNFATPKYAVISVGDNSYGHPTQEVLNKLEDSDIETLRTDKDGNILFAISNNYEVKYICDNFYITNLTLDYRCFVLVLEFALMVAVAIIIFKKTNKS